MEWLPLLQLICGISSKAVAITISGKYFSHKGGAGYLFKRAARRYLLIVFK